MRRKSKVIKIPANATETSMMQALDEHLNTGWKFVGVYRINSDDYAILIKTVAR